MFVLISLSEYLSSSTDLSDVCVAFSFRVPEFIHRFKWCLCCFLFQSTWVDPQIWVMFVLLSLSEYLSSSTDLSDVCVAFSFRVPEFIHRFKWCLCCFLFQSTWVDPQIWVMFVLLSLSEYPSSSTDLSDVCVAFSFRVPEFIHRFKWCLCCFLFQSTWVHPQI